MKLRFLLMCFLFSFSFSLTTLANPVTVKMNAVSKTMKLQKISTGENIVLPQQNNSLEYELDLDPGDYLITGIDKDGQTINGTIVMNVTDSTTLQHRAVITCTAYVSNKDEDGRQWTKDNGDYSLSVKVNTREGVEQSVTPGNSSTAGRYTFLAFNGNSYNVAFEPSEAHKADGFMTLYRGGTLTANVNISGSIPQGGEFCITVPSDAELHVGMKFTHFTDFTLITPTSVEVEGDGTVYRYTLANGQVYNYRTWKNGGLTHGGYFTMNLDEAKCPKISFSDEDYAKEDPKKFNHDVQSNKGYETGDILLNINPNGHLILKPGETFKVHAMRMWELSDNSTNNYFFEPDFHYTVIDPEGYPSEGVIKIENADTHDSAWSDIVAVGQGTAIVLVTYDGINLNYYNNADKKEYLGGEYWGAIWPENTGVFVVTVGEGESLVKPEMIVNEQYNIGALRLAGKYADAEHDVFYFLDDQDHYPFVFTPEGASEIMLASPVFSDAGASYHGFGTDGVVRNEDGSYTLSLKEGRNIVMLTDAAGRSIYRVLRAKHCHREITNLTREGSTLFQPGDKIKIQYSGLFHPANKIAGIYNMSAYVTYNGIPNGSSLILGSGQYTFGSAASAQAVTVEIPENYDAVSHPEWIMDQGVIQVNGYGDPIGNHRNTSPTAGRSPNFTAVPHQTYFGSIPDIRIPVNPMKLFDIFLVNNVEDAETSVAFGEKVLQPDDTGRYSWTYGTYNVTAVKDGFRCYRNDFLIEEGADTEQIFKIVMEEGSEGMWDGKSVSEVLPDENGDYHVSTGAQLAYIADNVTSIKGRVILENDIDLGDFDWNPIGNSSSKAFTASFDGQGHKVTGLYINRPSVSYAGLFGYVKGTDAEPVEINNVTVEGFVGGKQYVGGIAGYLTGNVCMSGCANYADVEGSSSYVGGLAGSVASAAVRISDSFNRGRISGTTNVGGIAGYNNASAVIENGYSTGEIFGTNPSNMGACVGGTTQKTNVTNLYTTRKYELADNSIVVSEETMASGEIAVRLGEAFFQTIGEDPAPVFDGLKVYYDESTDEYYNMATGIHIDLGEGNEEVSIEDDTLTMAVDGCWLLSLIPIPEKARLPEVVWTSDNEKVAVLDIKGHNTAIVKAKSPGIAEIKVYNAEDPDVFDTCGICVNTVPTSVEIIFSDSQTGKIDVFDISGRIIRLDASPEFIRNLNSGVYILKSGDRVMKILGRIQ